MRGFAPLRAPAALLLAAVLFLSACGSSSSKTAKQPATPSAPAEVSASASASGHVATANAGTTTATLRAGTHKPRVGVPWPIHLTVTREGSPEAATVSYEFLFGGAPVAHRSHFTFHGSFSDLLDWPANAVGYALTFRAVVSAAGSTINLDFPVRVQR